MSYIRNAKRRILGLGVFVSAAVIGVTTASTMLVPTAFMLREPNLPQTELISFQGLLALDCSLSGVTGIS